MVILVCSAISLRAHADQASPSSFPPSEKEAAHLYRWARRNPSYTSMVRRFEDPPGFKRVAAAQGSFAYFLRHLPMLAEKSPVRSYLGRIILAPNHPALAGVIDLDMSRRDRQQCADTIMRLRGEYLFSSGRAERTSFLWAGGIRFGFGHWIQGMRPVKQAGRWSLKPTARASRSTYKSFRSYLEYMFVWTGTLHMAGEPRPNADTLQAGDFFIQGGSPGHAVIILDLARSPHGKLKALMGQGFMPAQDLHVLRAADGDPWFSLDPPTTLVETPLWLPFRWIDLRRFRY